MTNEMKNPQMLSLQESSVSESQRQIAVEDEYKLRELELHVERQRETLGDSHFNTLEAMHDLSLEYQFSQQWENAHDLQQAGRRPPRHFAQHDRPGAHHRRA
jgi:hypothetical protein